MATQSHYDKTPPHNADAEKALVGSVLLEPQQVFALSVDGADFHNPACSLIITTAREMVAAEGHVDAVTLAEELQSKGHLEQIGGVGVIHELMEAVPHAGNASYYADIVKDYSIRREVIHLAREAEKKAHDPTVGISELQTLVALGEPTNDITPLSVAALAAEYPNLAEPVIEGLIRRGETSNIIAASKVGKSWLTYGLAISIATGQRWLGTYDCCRGNVLLLDNELHISTLAQRIPTVADAMNVLPGEYQDRLDVVSLRGRLTDLYGIGQLVSTWGIPTSKN